MVKSIEEYIAETTKSYQPSIDQYNSQIAGLDTSKASDLANLERSYASQQEGLERQKNRAAETASLAAAARGGAFGGASNIARRNYYEDTFVPAVTKLNSDKASSTESLNKNYNERRSSLEQQLANLYSQANTYGTQRYDDALKQEEAIRQYNEQMAEQQRQYNENLAFEKARQEEAIRQFNENLALQKAQLEESKRQHNASIAAQRYAADVQSRAYNYLNNNQPTYKQWDFGNGYTITNVNGNAVYSKNGKQVSAGDFLSGANTNWDLWNDIWNNKVNTAGVGADTVSDFSRMSWVNPNGSQFGYLWNQW